MSENAKDKIPIVPIEQNEHKAEVPPSWKTPRPSSPSSTSGALFQMNGAAEVLRTDSVELDEVGITIHPE